MTFTLFLNVIILLSDIVVGSSSFLPKIETEMLRLRLQDSFLFFLFCTWRLFQQKNTQSLKKRWHLWSSKCESEYRRWGWGYKTDNPLSFAHVDSFNKIILQVLLRDATSFSFSLFCTCWLFQRNNTSSLFKKCHRDTSLKFQIGIWKGLLFRSSARQDATIWVWN